ncbi:hypothetical protein [Snodgrassella sp. CFCC 13594]|uniref:hypothetical protein n=1 Tax=Snodgrassella sp. CFCC 13594 TaxID=1775559 RepID=UPI000835BC9B|nr:hypothetical protein [Snodgrassella sp. CFCC 13594]
MHNTQLVRDALHTLLVAGHTDVPTVAQFFCPDYEQWTNEVHSDFAQFQQHLMVLQQKVHIKQLEFITLMGNQSHVFSHHRVTVQRPDGSCGRVLVLADFSIRNGLIGGCVELTHAAAAEDQHLGSIRVL